MNLVNPVQTFISKLEIYTFGAAANHFNSPVTLPGVDGRPGEPIVKHVEVSEMSITCCATINSDELASPPPSFPTPSRQPPPCLRPFVPTSVT